MTLKKIHLLLLSLLLSISLCYGVETGKSYYIFHSSGYALSSADENPDLHTFQSANDQEFEFESSGNYYLIKSKKNGQYIAKTGTWNTEYTTNKGNSSQFEIEEIGGDFIRLKNRDNSLFLGTDEATPGSSIYSDKDGSNPLHYWFIREASTNIIITDGLEASIEKAKSLLANTLEGTTAGTFSKENRETLQIAIDEAESLISNSSQEEINQLTMVIQNACKEYNSSQNPPYSVGATYYIVHAGNRILTYDEDKLLLKEPDYSKSQQFTIEKLNDGTLTLRNVMSNKYVSAFGEYSTTLSANTENLTSHIKINYAESENFYSKIQFASNNLYLGTDGTTEGSGVYSNKSGNDGKHYWQLIPIGSENQQPYNSFRNGSSSTRLGLNWLDEEGNHINAHGGCVLYKDGTYYWFGENYRKTPVKSNGIVCYTSKDLYNWKYECMAYECPNASLRSDYQDMNYGRTLERPKVMYNPTTNQYVMWVHWENGSGYAASRVAILHSKDIKGPYTFVKTMRPRGDEQPSGSRDQTLLYDPEYQIGYHFGSAEENMTMHATLLTEDFLDLSNTWERIFIKKQYEAPAVIKYHGRFIAITSGCTGWDPNAAHASYSELPLEGWTDLGNPCVDENANKTYNSQSNFIFKIPNLYNAYIYMGDRWKGGDYFNDANVGESWHIWLPIDMRTGYPIIHFYSEWNLSLFNKLNRYRRVSQFEEGREYVLLSRNANRILSDKSGKFLLTEDNDEQNITFTIWKLENENYILINTKTHNALSAESGNLCWTDSTGTQSQLWKINKTGNDGYYNLSPASNTNIMLTNLCATVSENGIIGLTKSSTNLNTKFAFCFDSYKYDYTPIENESDGSYSKWIESLGYEYTKIETFNADKETKSLTIIVGLGEGCLQIKSLKQQDVNVYNYNGQIIKHLKMNENELISLNLPKGIYIVNDIKVAVGF